MQPKKLTVHLITTVYEGLLKLGTSEQESYSIFLIKARPSN